MGKVLWKTAVLLGAIFCLNLSPGGVSAEIRMPDEGVTIILRAPMHHLQVVKQVKGKPDEIIPGLEVSLPKNTPIRFKVDQVNTVLYKVQITATEEIPQHETGMEVWQQAFHLFAGLSEKYQGLFPSEERDHKFVDDSSSGAAKDPMQQVVACLKHKTQRAEKLGKKLDAYLQRTEKRQFYIGTAAEVNAGFERIKMDAAKAAQKTLELASGTHGEILKTVQKTHQEICDVLATSAKSSVSKDSFDTTINRFKTALTKATAKLERIENATWQQEDTQIRILKNKMKFTCVITRIAQDSEDDSSKRREFAVTLNPESWGILISPMPGILVSTLRDASYVVREKKDRGKEVANRSIAENMPASDEAPGVDAMPADDGNMPADDEMQAAEETAPANDEASTSGASMPEGGVMSAGDGNMPAADELPRKFIKRRGSEDDFTISGGALIHVHSDKLGPLALSGGIAVDGNKNLRAALGVSLLFHTSKEQLLAFTAGTIVGKVKRLDGYKVGDFFAEDTPPTKLVYRRGWFGALTYNFKFDSILGSGQTGNSTK